MNPELEKLVNYALVDGYITEKEKKVLIKKAGALGFDLDELEMILEGKQHEVNNTIESRVNKCPSCGEIMSGLSKVCPSCDYVLNSESAADTEMLGDAMKRLEDSVFSLKAIPKQGASGIVKTAFYSLITGGLYIIYKKFVKKESFFDQYSTINEKIVASTDMQIFSLRNKYSDDERISNSINQLVEQRDGIIKKRKTSNIISAFVTIVIISIVIYLIMLVPAPSADSFKSEESAEDKTERHITAGRISMAKLAAAKMEDSAEKDAFLIKIRDLEIDSLTAAGSFNEALTLARQIKNPDYISTDMEDKIDKIVETQVNDLIAKKEFTKAREQAALASNPKDQYLLTSIKVEEYLAKQAEKKEKEQAKKTSRKKRKK